MTVDADAGGVPDHLKPPTICQDRQSGPTFEQTSVVARPLRLDIVGGDVLETIIDVQGRRVTFDIGRDESGQWAMAPAAGELDATVSVAKIDLLAAVEAKARAEAKQHGVIIDQLDADVSAPSENSAQVAGRLTGSKKVAFFNASFAIDFVAELTAEPDEQGELVGRVTRLDLSGDGAVMSVVLSLAKPVVEKVKQRPLPLGDVLAAAGVAGLQVRHVSVEAGERLTLRASFGTRL